MKPGSDLTLVLVSGIWYNAQAQSFSDLMGVVLRLVVSSAAQEVRLVWIFKESKKKRREQHPDTQTDTLRHAVPPAVAGGVAALSRL